MVLKCKNCILGDHQYVSTYNIDTEIILNDGDFYKGFVKNRLDGVLQNA